MRHSILLFYLATAKNLKLECFDDENCDEIEEEYYGGYYKGKILTWLVQSSRSFCSTFQESVLILKTDFFGGIGPVSKGIMEAAVVSDGKGNAREAKFTFPNNTMVHHSCSMTHLGQFYIVGGNMGDHAKQMRKRLNQASSRPGNGLRTVDFHRPSTHSFLHVLRTNFNFEKRD